jgi:hypothetical protein
MRNPFRRWLQRQPERTEPVVIRRSVIYFCATCDVGEGERHESWCYRKGIMASEYQPPD